MNGLRDYEDDTISISTLALEEYLEDKRESELSELRLLSKKVCYLHSSLLYYRNTKTKRGEACYEAWKSLVKKIGCSTDTWKHLGHALGITQADLEYIMNSSRYDPADVVLKVFTQNEKATLDKLLDVLLKMQRYDILKAVESPLRELAESFEKHDSGYHSSVSSSNTNHTTQKQIITYATDLINDIPPALLKKYIANEDPNKPKQQILKALNDNAEITKKNDSPILFLTYTDDGKATARNIKYYLENWTDFATPVTVLTLNDNKEEVFQNPEKFIREYFEKADLVVPIVTTGYLQEIKSTNSSLVSTSDNLDCKYVNFVYNLIINVYIHKNGCMNKKVRSVLPQYCNVSILRDITMYPDLMPWTLETKFDQQFKVFLKKKFQSK